MKILILKQVNKLVLGCAILTMCACKDEPKELVKEVTPVVAVKQSVDLDGGTTPVQANEVEDSPIGVSKNEINIDNIGDVYNSKEGTGAVAEDLEVKKPKKVELEYDNPEVTNKELIDRARSKAANQFHTENNRVEIPLIKLNKDPRLDGGKKLVQEKWKNEVTQDFINHLVQMDKLQKNWYDTFSKNQLGELVALAIDRAAVQNSTRRIQDEIDSLEYKKEQITKWEKRKQEIVNTPTRDGMFALPVSDDNALNQGLSQFTVAVDKYYAELLEFSGWVDQNWERFNVTDGVRIIKDPRISKSYRDRSEQVVAARKKVETARKNYVLCSEQIKDRMLK